MNPFLPSLVDALWERHQERLHQAEQWQQGMRAPANGFSRENRLRVRVGEHLIALGQYLKAAPQPAPHLD